MAARTSEVLQEAKRQGWTAMAGPKHWKLVPPNGLSDAYPRPFILPHGANQRDRGDAFANSMRTLRTFGDPGRQLADTIEGTNGAARKPKGPAEPQWIDPDPPAPPAPPAAPDPTQFTAGVETITPTIALKMLGDLFEGQRKVRDGDVQRYADDMRAGHWTISNDAISFDTDGRLINGQHRLLAVIRADMPIEALVVRGLPVDSFDAMDTGRRRTLAHRLKAQGSPYITAVAGGLTRLQNYADTGDILYAGHYSVPKSLAFYEQHPGVLQAAALTVNFASNKFKFSHTLMTAVGYIWTAIDPAVTVEFIDEVVQGGGEVRSPSTLLRNALATRMGTPVHRRQGQAFYLALILKAWNAYMRGDRPQLLRWAASEGFPAFWDPEEKLVELFPGDSV